MHKFQVLKVVEANYSKLGISEINYFCASDLGEGENNLNFLVTIDNKYNFVFRICMRKEFEKNVKREFEWLKKIPPNFGPTPLVYDKSKKVIPKAYSVLSFIEGKHIYKWTLRHLKLHAEKLAQLHNKKYDFCGKKWKAKKKKINFYKEAFLDEVEWYKKHAKWIFKDPAVEKLYHVIKKYAKDNAHCFDKMKKFPIIHSDPDITNIIFTKKGIKYIDWENVQTGDPAKDLSHLFYLGCSCPPWRIQLSDKKLDKYLNHYIKKSGKKDKTLKKRVIIWSEITKFSDLLYFTWKLKNYNKEHVKRPRKTYIQAIEAMKRSLVKKFLD